MLLIGAVLAGLAGSQAEKFEEAQTNEASSYLPGDSESLRVAVTGVVITSAGIVLAGTFSILGVLPLVTLTEIGFTIAFGVLLDTFIMRSVLVPALVLDIGPKTWWPSELAREDGSPEHAGAARPADGAVATAGASEHPS